MKQLQAEYSDNSITYWPTYEAGKIGRVFLVVSCILFVATSLCLALGNSTRATRLGILLVFPFVMTTFYYALSYVSRIMHMKIVVSSEGIAHFKSKTTIEKQIGWEDVTAVYFFQDPWYGRKSCRIYLKKAQSPRISEKDKCDYVLPVNSVDERKLLRLIPSCLWKNNPQWIW